MIANAYLNLPQLHYEYYSELAWSRCVFRMQTTKYSITATAFSNFTSLAALMFDVLCAKDIVTSTLLNFSVHHEGMKVLIGDELMLDIPMRITHHVVSSRQSKSVGRRLICVRRSRDQNQNIDMEKWR